MISQTISVSYYITNRCPKSATTNNSSIYPIMYSKGSQLHQYCLRLIKILFIDGLKHSSSFSLLSLSGGSGDRGTCTPKQREANRGDGWDSKEGRQEFGGCGEGMDDLFFVSAFWKQAISVSIVTEEFGRDKHENLAILLFYFVHQSSKAINACNSPSMANN